MDRFPLRIVIRYDEILPIRRRRVERLLAASFRVFAALQTSGSMRAAIVKAFARGKFECALRELLALYVQEKRALSCAARLPLPLLPLREIAVDRLATVMTEVARRLASDSARIVFRDRRANVHRAMLSRRGHHRTRATA
jgi:hypothetical protein